jgi:hypothetical protein
LLLSDGIAEATDANRELFGFERAYELLRTASSATAVVTAAQKFRQGGRHQCELSHPHHRVGSSAGMRS